MMIFLKYFLFIIIVLVVIFFSFGLLKPTVSYGHEITVDQPIKEVWAIFQDDSKYPDWLAGFQSIELIEGNKGEIGSKYKVVVKPGEGQPEFQMTETLTSKKEYEYITLNFDSDMMIFDQTTSLSTSNGKTTLKTESKVKGKGIMMKSMFSLMETLGGTFTAQEKKNIEALKTVIESNTTDYYPTLISSENIENE